MASLTNILNVKKEKSDIPKEISKLLTSLEKKKKEFANYEKNYLEKVIQLNDLKSKLASLEDNIVKEKEKFLSKDSIDNFSLTEKIAHLQKDYSKLKESIQQENKSITEIKVKMEKHLNELEKNISFLEKEKENYNFSNIKKDFKIDNSFNENNEKQILEKAPATNAKKIEYFIELEKDYFIKKIHSEFEIITLYTPLLPLIEKTNEIRNEILEKREILIDLDEEGFLNNNNLLNEILEKKEIYTENITNITNTNKTIQSIFNALTEYEHFIKFIRTQLNLITE
ncbi:hypothetical protein EV215_0774 [Hypnocyclicus thermotrophus]|uniref:Uncharacterized protein n=1 Tax=Hypnocyclicus thermotrophus TaxID=1627895 RepID=A0AA46I5X9_9FUSO|nr:hypothetical protein [Hypnocyclicus thermotrophus]TDT71401.1 hypothetical protein EV215_0774 [Hypnocyclicus thermotrophus]